MSDTKQQESSVNSEAAAAAPTPPTAPTTSAPPLAIKEEKNVNQILIGSYGLIALLWAGAQIIHIPYVVHLVLLVTAILYAACHHSLVLREEVPTNGDTDESSSDRGDSILRKEDAYHFPLIGSASLFSLYLAFKFLDKDIVNLLIGGYFAVVGCLALTATFSPVISIFAPKRLQQKMGWEYEWHHSLPAMILGESPLDLGLEFTWVDVGALLISAVICVSYFLTKHWSLNNVLGICFCLQAMERFSLGTYKISAILLIGLFFYDIFWVFGTDVMVTVAKNLDGPIKLLFPKSLERNEETGKLDMSLLGLGDIVIPGFFLALLLRFDAEQAEVPCRGVSIHAPFPKPYFHWALFAYVLGLITTLFVMMQFNAAQPALLYLVPACLGSSMLCAVLRKEVKELLEYSEEVEEEDDEANNKKKKAIKEE